MSMPPCVPASSYARLPKRAHVLTHDDRRRLDDVACHTLAVVRDDAARTIPDSNVGEAKPVTKDIRC
jgi:hypothetical protein